MQRAWNNLLVLFSGIELSDSTWIHLRSIVIRIFGRHLRDLISRMF